MATNATAVWEVRPTGSGSSDNNGGGYDSGISGAGTDYSQQDSPQLALSDLAAAQNSTTLTSTTGGFTAAMIGNAIGIPSGTNFTPGVYWVTARTDTNTVTLDRAPATTGAGSGGTGNVGGALASPGQAGGYMVGGNQAWVKGGTYLITSTSSNVSGGVLSLPANTSASLRTRMSGYQTTRGDNGTKPILKASGISTFTLATLAAGSSLHNLEFDGNSLASGQGVNCTAGHTRVSYCRFRNFTGGVARNNQVTSEFWFTAFTGNSSFTCIAGGYVRYCSAYANTVTPYNVTTINGSDFAYCVSANNTGASTDGFGMFPGATARLENCLAYNNGRDGVRVTGASGVQGLITNLICVSNAGFGLNLTAAYDALKIVGYADYNNTLGALSSAASSADLSLHVALTGDPFTSAAGLNFLLNNTAGAGASCRAAGIPDVSGLFALPDLSTAAYADLGPSQHLDGTSPQIPVAGGVILL